MVQFKYDRTRVILHYLCNGMPSQMMVVMVGVGVGMGSGSLQGMTPDGVE